MKIDKKNIIITFLMLILLILAIFLYNKFFYTPDYNENVKTLLALAENKQCFKNIIKKEYTKEELENTLVKGRSIESVNNIIKIEHLKKINKKKYYSIFKEKKGKLALAIWEKEKKNLICTESMIFYKKIMKNEILDLIENGYKYNYFKENIEGDYTDPKKTRATLHSHHYTNDGYCIYIEYFEDMEIEPINAVYVKYDYNCSKEKILNSISSIDLIEMMKDVNCYNTKKVYCQMHGGIEFGLDFVNGLKADYENAEKIITPYIKKDDYLISLTNNEKSFNKIITQKYSKEQLIKYINDKNEYNGKINFTINKINSENKIECIRKLQSKYEDFYYSILQSEDGLLIVKYIKGAFSFDAYEKILTSVDLWYMDKVLYSTDFKNIICNVNTMESVRNIDKYGSFFIYKNKTETSDIIYGESIHNTLDGKKVLIKYNYLGGDIENYKNFAVKNIEIKNAALNDACSLLDIDIKDIKNYFK